GGAPAIKHVFVVNLENKGYNTTFGPDSKAPYLSKTLSAQGALLTQYYGTAHASLGNYLAQISGLAPSAQHRADCGTFTNFAPATPAADGQYQGDGCVYPASVPTLVNQLTTAGLTWRGYMQDMGNDPARESDTCAHPAIGAADNTQGATVKDQYATRHNPFAY